ncbi:ornithine carbamoyltransferase [Streptomyces sp. NBC_01236]|uniref:ornithine carbamoyltransferase n=1 Tax=Streptomyces sp. NBC_01236 TaxID=2903789 RepID=UPI002E14D9A4|nr:ornithine carbamoyltransferase [Streptomyces sp. NBC_01236]
MSELLLREGLLDDARLTSSDLFELLDIARSLKKDRRERRESSLLARKNIALIFEKPSTRTRCAFEVAARDQGAGVTFLTELASHMDVLESLEDTAHVLGRMYDGIAYRARSQDRIEAMARHSGIPVWNGMSDIWHPSQMVCDLMTAREFCRKPWNEMVLTFIGDGRSNVVNSLLVGGALAGMHIRVVSPTPFAPSGRPVETANRICTQTGGSLVITPDLEVGVVGADFIYTDVWVWIQEPRESWLERVDLLHGYDVTRHVLAMTGNPSVKFMHCLPSLHDCSTRLGKELRDHTGRTHAEVTDEVFRSSASIVFDQAENRMHAIKAIMVASLVACGPG